MALYAGQSVGAVRRRQRVADIVAELVEGAKWLLQRCGQADSDTI